jgi:hypothetical protein
MIKSLNWRLEVSTWRRSDPLHWYYLRQVVWEAVANLDLENLRAPVMFY